MPERIEDNVALCPNCDRIFAITYTNHRCPFCGTYLMPSDTMAGCPMRDLGSQVELAQELRDDY